MILTVLYLICLFIAPQLWLEPFVGLNVDYILFALWAIYLGSTGKLGRIRFGDQEKFFLLWILWVFLSILFNGALGNRSLIVINYAKWFVLFLFVQASLDTLRSVRIVVYWLVFISLLLAVEGIQHYANDIGWAGQTLGWASAGAKGRTRWVGIFDGPGVFCVVYTIALPFLLHWAFICSWLKRMVALAALAIMALAIFYNGSRGGFITALFVVCSYLVLKYRSKFALTVGAAVTLVLFLLAPTHMTDLSDDHHSSSHRVEMWAEGCEMFKDNPVFGIGRGGFSRYTGKLIAHNSMVEIMGETGLFGLFFWVGLIFMNLKRGIAACSPQFEEAHPLALPLVLSILGYLVSAMFVTLEYETLYLLLGISAAFHRSIGVDTELTKIDLKRIALITVGFIIFINLFVVLLGPAAFR